MSLTRLRRWWWGGVLALWLISLGAAAVPPVRAAGPVTFTVTVASAYLRDTPSPNGAPTFSAFQGQTYVVTGRTADSAWLALDAAGASGGTWIRASFGTVAGTLSAVPVTGAVSVAAPAGATPAPQASPAATNPVALVGNNGGSTGTGVVGLTLPFTVTAKSSYVRSAPNFDSNRIASLFSGAQTTAISRDANGWWVRVEYGGGALGWLPMGVGTLGGQVLNLPLDGNQGGPITSPAVPLNATPTGPMPAWVPTITTRMSTLYRQAAANGRDPNMFAVVGDCNSEEWLFQGVVAVGNWDYVNHPYLAPTVRKFGNAFLRDSVAVSGGYSAASILDPLLANPTQCKRGESPFACELRVTRASLVFIELGTGDHFFWDKFEGNYRTLIEYALSQKVLPILRTKADSLETEERGAPQGYINDVIRRLGAEYEVPVLDFELATRDMPNHGLVDEPGHDFHVSGEAIGEHVLSSLQTLYAIVHAP